MIDLTKLSPAPWTWDRNPSKAENRDDSGFEGNVGELRHPQGLVASFGDSTQYYPTCGEEFSEPDAAFICLARAAFEVMIRRGVDWIFLEQMSDGILVDCPDHGFIPGRWPDPFTALVEADKWLKEQEAQK